jgi:hypothetical protein
MNAMSYHIKIRSGAGGAAAACRPVLVRYSANASLERMSHHVTHSTKPEVETWLKRRQFPCDVLNTLSQRQQHNACQRGREMSVHSVYLMAESTG